MFFGNDRQQLRQAYFDVWSKLEKSEKMTPLEVQISQVIKEHPEYHSILQQQDKYVDQDFSPELGETNPFLHMALHLAVQEQYQTNRPKGISPLFQKALVFWGSQHDAEHTMMESMAESIWQIQRHKKPISDNEYLKLVKKHFRKNNIR